MPLTLVCRDFSRVRARPPAAVEVRPFVEGEDAAPIHELVGSISGGVAEPIPRAAGLVSELRSRPGRRVQAWLAWEVEVDPYRERPLGLVTLVQATVREGRRWSIGWLIVRPEARRQGVGRGLVATALEAAAAAGASAVWAETDARWEAARGFWHDLGFEAA